LVAQRAPRARLSGRLFEGCNGTAVDAASIPPAQGGGGMVGVPDLWTLGVKEYISSGTVGGIGGHSDFSPILPANGKVVADWYLLAKSMTEAAGFDAYVGGVLRARSFTMIHMFVYDKTDTTQRLKVEKLFRDLVHAAKKQGIGKYRSHINHMGMCYKLHDRHGDADNPNIDIVADMYSFNNHAHRRFVEGLKV